MDEVSQQYIDDTRREIDLLLLDNPKLALEKISELNRQYEHAADFYLGIAYFAGFGIDLDRDRARKYFQNAIRLHDNLEGDALYFIALGYQSEENYQEALKYHLMAVDKDKEESFEQGAVCMYSIGVGYRKMAERTLKMDEFTAYNALAIQFACDSLSVFSSVVDDKKDMQTGSWCCFGRAAEFLYTVACRGEFTTEIKEKNLFSSYFSSGLEIFSQRNNSELHEKYWECLVTVCDAMDGCGHEILGEYFRALGGLVDTEFHHSAQAFYRTRWHMKRIGELRSTVSPEKAEEIHSILGDIDARYNKMSKKYMALTDQMIRKGEYPILEPSYPEGKVPEVESCQNFMKMYNSCRANLGSEKQSAEPKRKGFFGLFKG